MLKRLLLLWIFSGSLSAFSQVNADTILTIGEGGYLVSSWRLHELGLECHCPQCTAKNKPDTLRAICLVTMFPNGIAHARMGYVVICEGKEVQYLDCRKRALKLPQVGWGYKLIDPNYKK